MIHQFAERYKLRVKKDECGDPIVQGSLGHLYEYGESMLGVCFMPPGKPRPKKWVSICRACEAVGMTLRQEGDTEGCLSFHPANRAQARAAIKAVGARPKRQMTPEQLAHLATIGFRVKAPTLEGHLAA